MTQGDRISLAGHAAVITGGGRGIGLATAAMLASCGAGVVINDVGSDPNGHGFDRQVADAGASAVGQQGGRATSSTDDIRTAEGGSALVESALNEYGRLDIVVHSAGIGGGGPFSSLSLDHLRSVLDVHLMGAVHVLQPAWQHMVEHRYGRIILTSSSAIFGTPSSVPYSCAKAALLGLASALRAETETDPTLDIKINVILPTAATRRGGPAQDVFRELGGPEQVAAVTTYLASPACTINGAILHAGASHFAQVFLGLTPGWAKGSPDLTPEEVRDHLADATDIDGFSVPRSPIDVTRLVATAALRNETEANARLTAWLAAIAQASARP